MRTITEILKRIADAEKLVEFKSQQLRIARNDLDLLQRELRDAYSELGLCACGKKKESECDCIAFASSEPGYCRKGPVFANDRGFLIKDGTYKFECRIGSPIRRGEAK